MVELSIAAIGEIPPETLYRILWLRVRVFVVEQDCAYPEMDGRDLEQDALLLWIAEGAHVLATARLLRERGLDDADYFRIGRVATDAAARGRGLAADLVRAAIERCERSRPGAPIVLDAQQQLTGWYARFGFAVAGSTFVEDGIPHVPMRRG